MGMDIVAVVAMMGIDVAAVYAVVVATILAAQGPNYEQASTPQPWRLPRQ